MAPTAGAPTAGSTLVGSGEVFTLTTWAANKLAKKPEDFKAKPKPTTPPMPQ